MKRRFASVQTIETPPLPGVRLNKALAAAGVCSRRKADALITAGHVSVNGTSVTELGTRIDPERDVICVRGVAVPLSAGEDRHHCYVMLHKPVQVVSTAADPEGRITVLDMLPESLRGKRLFPVGRLDYFSEGLLLLTDDGALTHQLTHPGSHLPRIYEARLRETPTREMVRAMRSGMILAEGEILAPVEAMPDPKDPHLLRLTLRQGVNRQIRRMCRDLGLTILSLRRTAFGPLHLGDLPKGACRPLSVVETAALRASVKR
jgi:23S rRNA pseudouridine2605 synthase